MSLKTIQEIEKTLKQAEFRITKGFPLRVIEKRLDELFHQLVLDINQELEEEQDYGEMKAKIRNYLRYLDKLQVYQDDSLGVKLWSRLLTPMVVLRTKAWRYAAEETEIQQHMIELLSFALTQAELEVHDRIRRGFDNLAEFLVNYRLVLTLGLEYWTLMDDLYHGNHSSFLEWTKKCIESFNLLTQYIRMFVARMQSDASFLADVDIQTLKNNFISFLSIYLQVYYIQIALLRRSMNRLVNLPISVELFQHRVTFTESEFLDLMDQWSHEIVNFIASFISILEETQPQIYNLMVQQGAFRSPYLIFFQNLLSLQQLQTNHFRMLKEVLDSFDLPLSSVMSCDSQNLLGNLRLLAQEFRYRISSDENILQDPKQLVSHADKILEIIFLVENLSCQLLYFTSMINTKKVVEELMYYSEILSNLPIGTFSFQDLHTGNLAIIAHATREWGNFDSKILKKVLMMLQKVRKDLKIRVLDQLTLDILLQLLESLLSGRSPKISLSESLLAKLPPSFQKVVLDYVDYCNHFGNGSLIEISPHLKQRMMHLCLADPLSWVVIDFPFDIDSSTSKNRKLRFIPFNYYVDRSQSLNTSN